jgi:hypothetical protein
MQIPPLDDFRTGTARHAPCRIVGGSAAEFEYFPHLQSGWHLGIFLEGASSRDPFEPERNAVEVVSYAALYIAAFYTLPAEIETHRIGFSL